MTLGLAITLIVVVAICITAAIMLPQAPLDDEEK